jgi:arginyl-tRNA synthetase
MNILDRLRAAFAAAAPAESDPTAFAAAVRPSTDPKFGDYQANGCMATAKAARRNPREVAQEVARAVDLAPLADAPEVAGPGFLNVRLREAWISAALGERLGDETLGLSPPARARTVVIDYSSPNVAKPMHVGHIRSTVIGESLARIIAALGHRVVRDNHLGDWGTQFGMIIWGWKHARDEAAFAADPVAELARLYRSAQARIQAGEAAVEDRARAETAKLHAGDPENRALWERFMPHCLGALQAMYDRLGVRFDVQLGESFYDPMLADVVDDLERRGSPARATGPPSSSSRGSRRRSWSARATAPRPTRPPTWPRSGIVRSAGIPIRSSTWSIIASRTTSSSSSPSRGGGAAPTSISSTSPSARSWGRIAGRSRPAPATSSAWSRSWTRRSPRPARSSTRTAPTSPRGAPEGRGVVGLGAIKYADLAQNRLSDYVFDWGKMLAMNGNTGAYLQYAYARIRSIFRKGGIDPGDLPRRPPAILLSHPAERALGVQILRLPEALELAAAELKPNILTDYLFDLANKFSTFFENCPVLKAESPGRRDSRLALCDLTARTLRLGLGLLGIDVVDRM